MSKIKDIWNFLMSHQLYRVVNIVIYIFYFVQSDYGIDYIPYVVSFFWGILIIIYDFFTKRVMFKQPYWILLLLLCVSYVISIATNFPTNLVHNGMNLVYLAISVFIFYSTDPDLSEDRKLKDIKIMNDVFIGIIFILGIVSITMFIFNVSYHLDGNIRQGFMESRLFGVFTSPNIMSMFGYVSCFMILINNYIKRGSWKKIQKFYVINVLTQYICYLLSSSRGTQLALVGFAIFLFLTICIRVLFVEKNKFKKIGKSLLLIVGICVSLSYLGQFIENGLSYIPSIVSSITTKTEEQVVVDETGKETVIKVKEPIEKVVIQHSEEHAEVSSGRLSIWRAGLKLVQQKPLFGVGDSYVYRSGNLSPQIKEYNLSEIDKSELRRAHGNMHNTYIAVLVKGGIVSFVILSLFIIFILKDNFFYIINKKIDFDSEKIQVYAITLAFLLSLFVNDLVENHLIFNNRDVMGLVFWSYLGYLNHFRIKHTNN